MIEKKYEELCSTPSDINEHLETLKNLATGKDVVELGVREVVSTWALLMGRPKRLSSFDIYRSTNIDLALEAASKEGIDFNFKVGSSLEAFIPVCDVLFIDTWHHYCQLKLELERLHSGVRERIALHDTVTYAHVCDEWEGYPDIYPKCPGKGIWDALEEFLEEHKEWSIEKHSENNNGLTIIVKNA